MGLPHGKTFWVRGAEMSKFEYSATAPLKRRSGLLEDIGYHPITGYYKRSQRLFWKLLACSFAGNMAGYFLWRVFQWIF